MNAPQPKQIRALITKDGRRLLGIRARENGMDVKPHGCTLRPGELVTLSGTVDDRSVDVTFRVRKGLFKGQFRLVAEMKK